MDTELSASVMSVRKDRINIICTFDCIKDTLRSVIRLTF